jgi:DNA-binding NtrC family response regulator
VLCGVGLKEIGRAAEDVAIQIATEEENGNFQRAARRLGVTDRTLQMRCANRRQTEENWGNGRDAGEDAGGAEIVHKA